MHFLNTLAAAALTLTSVTSASPLSQKHARQASTAPERFYLETRVAAAGSDKGTNKGGLYVFSYHTGAGTGAAAAQAGDPAGSWFEMNGTQLLFTYTDNQLGGWPMRIEYGSTYQGEF